MMMPMNRGIYVIAMAGIAALLLSSMGGRSAHATAAIVPMPPGVTADAAVALNTPYNLGAQGNLYICVSVDRTITNIYLVDPANNFHNYSGPLPLPITIPANNCLYLEANDFVGLAAGFDQVGNWALLADIQGGFSFLYEFVVTFQVIPESIIGALAVTLPSIGALAGYRVLKSRSK